jgi:signal transduction histidine kinase/ActR/RegA family two-component response regulator/HAMP domain-containing protein
MNTFSSLRVRLVGMVFLAMSPAWVLMYLGYLPWAALIPGLLALGAAWYGGERFINRQVRRLSLATQRLATGDLTSRTGLSGEGGELGQLARKFDQMAASLEKRARDREQSEKDLLYRSLQQTVVGALGQFALVTKDFDPLLNQAVVLTAQTLELEYCNILELEPDGTSLFLRAGIGWNEGCVGRVTVPATDYTQSGFVLTVGEPVVFDDLSQERRFAPSRFLVEHGVRSGITVAISGHGRPFGLLGAHTTHHRIFSEDEVHFLLSVGTLLSMAVERNRTEGELQKLAAFAQLNPNPAMELAADATVTYFNDAALKLALSVGQDNPHAILPTDIAVTVKECLYSRQSKMHFETQHSWSIHPVLSSQVVHCYVEDITERLSLEAQLRQSQKMESVGQLAAGVAHDFNNMLTIIQGHVGMLMAKRKLPPDLQESVQAVYFAAERAATLTRQLLMFSRKNVMQPKPLDLREIVANVSKMLQRLLGEDIALELNAPTHISLVQGDMGMIEQVLMNLAVNARDAMPRGGKLTISTNTVEVNEAYAQIRPDAHPGLYVCLRVDDTGCGMDPATMRRIFEPFFTTKEVGKGTGLGLATVYGIVKQHGGWIEVASEVGRGTTFNVYFPATGAPVVALQQETAETITEIPGGKETILVVEDEPVLRDLAQAILQDCGYQVLEAGTGSEALQVLNRHDGHVDLLLTDMVMPDGMSGMELAQRLRDTHPELKIIFASGYSMEELDTGFIRQGHAQFLQKPYTHVTLPKAVRECLDGSPN